MVPIQVSQTQQLPYHYSQQQQQQQQQFLPPGFVPVGFVTPQPNVLGGGNFTIVTPQHGYFQIAQAPHFVFQPQATMTTFVCDKSTLE